MVIILHSAHNGDISPIIHPYDIIDSQFYKTVCTEKSIQTRTTRMPAFWGYPPAASWLPTLLSHVGSQVKIRSNDLEDIGQGQRSSHATHLLMLVIMCIKYGKNPSRTIDATERTRFSRSRPNDLENLGQGQRSLHATHPLILVIICDKYGKNPLRTVDYFFQGQGRKISKIWQKFKFPDFETNVTRDTPSNDSDHLCQI